MGVMERYGNFGGGARSNVERRGTMPSGFC